MKKQDSLLAAFEEFKQTPVETKLVLGGMTTATPDTRSGGGDTIPDMADDCEIEADTTGPVPVSIGIHVVFGQGRDTVSASINTPGHHIRI